MLALELFSDTVCLSHSFCSFILLLNSSILSTLIFMYFATFHLQLTYLRNDLLRTEYTYRHHLLVPQLLLIVPP